MGDFDLSQLGATLDAAPYHVTREAMIAYARATNDDNPAHLSGAVAPPLFAVVPALKTMARAKRLVTEAFTFHGEHDLTFERPILAGMTLQVRAEVTGVIRTGAGTAIVVRGVTKDARGDLLNTQYLVVLAQGRHVERTLGAPAPDHRTPDGVTAVAPDAEAHQAMDDDQTRRYGEASGDREAYTYDPDLAREKGLPGPIVHGLCTMAFLGRLVVDSACAGDVRRLRRLAVRFTQPLIMESGQFVTSRLWRRPDPGQFAAECLDRHGHAVIRHGLATVTQ